MGFFGFRKKKQAEEVDIFQFLSELPRDGRDLVTYAMFRPKSAATVEDFEVINHYDMMIDSIELILQTKYPRTFFYRYQFAVENAEAVRRLSFCGTYAKRARQVLEILDKHKAEIVNAFLKRSYEAGKFPYVKGEIMAERTSMPKESFDYFCHLLKNGVSVN